MLYPLSYEGKEFGIVARHPGPSASGHLVPAVGPARPVGCAAMAAPTVLVVEDDPTILQLLEVNFEMEGFTVLRAADGRDRARAGQAPARPTSSSPT